MFTTNQKINCHNCRVRAHLTISNTGLNYRNMPQYTHRQREFHNFRSYNIFPTSCTVNRNFSRHTNLFPPSYPRNSLISNGFRRDKINLNFKNLKVLAAALLLTGSVYSFAVLLNPSASLSHKVRATAFILFVLSVKVVIFIIKYVESFIKSFNKPSSVSPISSTNPASETVHSINPLEPSFVPNITQPSAPSEFDLYPIEEDSPPSYEEAIKMSNQASGAVHSVNPLRASFVSNSSQGL